jgi:signal transduction histidine kinase/ligand-binding sensor domain-containing protein/DNA-binding response OmpR family regulator/photosystem II stability/assembly factor-like uncharacterized protein
MAGKKKLLLYFLTFPFILLAQTQDIKFEHISVEQGLSHSTVQCILQDSRGYMWFGTEEGLNKYDGYKFTIYKHNPDDPYSLSHNNIRSLYEDKSGVLWIGTDDEGLNQFDREKEQFIHYLHDPMNPKSVQSNRITQIYESNVGEKDVLWIGTNEGLDQFNRQTGEFKYCISESIINVITEDPSGELWIGTFDNGLYKLDREQEKFINYLHHPDIPNNLGDNIQSTYADKSGMIWIGVENEGLKRFNPETRQVTNFRYDPGNSHSLSNNTVNTIYQDKSGVLWIGTRLGGLNKFDHVKEQFIRYQNDPGNPYSLSDNSISCLYEDRSGVLWIGTWGGINKFDPQKQKFSHYRNNPGNINSLSNNFVTAIYESNFGGKEILWIGTKGGGLNKLDRRTGQYTHYKHDPENPNSLSNNIVMAITESCCPEREKLWIGTYDGLNEFDPITEQFTSYTHDSDNTHSISSNIISAICENKSGILWIGTQSGGLNKFNPKTKQFTQLGPTQYPIQALVEDNRGVLWIATTKGLAKLEPETEQFIYYRHDTNNPNSISYDQVSSIYETRYGADDVLWIGTTRGLNKFNRKTEKFTQYTEKDGIANNVINGILEDKNGNLWISTNKGLSNLIPKNIRFENFDVNDGLQSNQFNRGACFQNKNGEMFFGGINGFNAFYTDSIEYNQQIPNVVITDFQILNKQVDIQKDEYQRRSIKTIDFVNSEIGWLAGDDILLKTENGGQTWSALPLDLGWGIQMIDFINDSVGWAVAQKFDDYKIIKTLDGGQTWLIRKRFEDNYSPNSFCVVSDSVVYMAGLISQTRYPSGRIIKTLDGGNSWIDITPENDRWDFYSIAILDSDIGIVSGKSWGLDGIVRTFDGGKTWNEEIVPYLIKIDDLQFVNDSLGYFLAENHLLFNTDDTYSSWNLKARGVISYHALDNNTVFAIKDGKVMRSLDRGFTWEEKYSDATDLTLIKFVDYSTGWIVGSNGTIFKTVDGGDSWINQSITIEQGTLQNTNVLSTLKPISHKGEIELSYEENFLSFEFAALDYHSPQKNLYAYKMEGIDPDWVYTDASRRFATYTQLDPGEYIFKVKGSNNDRIWNDQGTSIKIIITPPWWRTNLAYAIYVIFFGVLVFGTWRMQLRRLRLNQQLKMEHFEAEKLREVDHLKSRFFANISHEFRTPLTLIKGPVKQMLSGEFKENTKEQFRMILRNSDRLLGLINQLLDLSKLESGRMALQVAKTDLAKFIKGLVLSFSSLAESKKITLNFVANDNSIVGYIDQDKLEKIITNLLSNAFKFTPVGGDIVVNVKKHPPESPLDRGDESVSPLVKGDKGGCKNANSQFPIPDSDFVEITITNTGPGIPPDRLEKIFDRFYQVDDSVTRHQEGTGIGLALTKELVELHHGTINVECRGMARHAHDDPESDTKTIFTVQLPISKEHYKPEEILETEDRKPEAEKHMLSDSIPDEDIGYHIPDTEEQSESSGRSPAPGLPSPLVLVVEDNPDVTTYIRSFLDQDYRIITATNGKEGWKQAGKEYPDLIISDVMMPEMDGFELCHKIKSDENTSHIPIILLTAKADMGSKIEGLEFGADDYISKPFDDKELRVRVKNLIEQRKKLREKFSLTIEIKPGEIAATSMDEQFLKRLLDVFENHVEDGDFSTEDFAREVGMSRSNLHRKLQALTNQPTHEFLRTLRLKRAAHLLKKSTGSVTEVAYSVGFNNLSHFTKIFRQQFGQTPSEFANKNQ